MNTRETGQITDADLMFAELKFRLGKIVPEFELRHKAELAAEINRLKKEMNAIILGHNYMEPALFHSVPDVLGDSLELSRKAAEATADIVIFCGVEFMAETAKILNPSRRVLLPALKAGCSLADSITGEDVRRLKEEYPGVPVICYINSNADVKAECDAVCTSGNADKVMAAFSEDKIIFIPDEYLTKNVANSAGKTVIVTGKNKLQPKPTSPFQVIAWEGRCEVHEQFSVEDIENARAQFPDVVVLAHPECSPEVVDASDFSGSTSKMIEFVRTTDAPRYLLLTECAMADNIVAGSPEKEMVGLCSIRCPHMNQITLEGVLNSLKTGQKEIFLDEKVAEGARRALDRMLAIH